MLKEVLTVSALIASLLSVRAVFQNRVPERILFLTKKQRTRVLCVILALLPVVSATGCSSAALTQQKPDKVTLPEAAEAAKDAEAAAAPEPQGLPAAQELGFAGANVGQGGLMAGDGEWVYYRSETDWGLYRARTDGSEQAQLLPPEEYAPNCINVLGDWVYFSNFWDGFSLWRVRTDGSDAKKLVDGYCYTFLVTESGIYYDCRDENNVMRTFHAELDGSAQTLLYESCAPATYYGDNLYLYDFRSGTLYAYRSETKEREILFEGKYNAAFFSADDTGVYFWDDMCDYCHLDPETKEITVLHKGPIGDYFNYYDGTVYYTAYGGENYDYDCCYAMDVETGEQKAILSLSPEMYDAFGNPIGITQVEYRTGNYDADSIPTNEEGWPMVLNELVDGLFIVNGQVFARGRLARTGMAETWILCDGESGTLWEAELTQQKPDALTLPEASEAAAAPEPQEQSEEAPSLDRTDAEYDDVKTWSWAPYETLCRTDGTRMGLVREADGTRRIGEVPDTKVWIRLKDGTLLSGGPFDACIDYMGTPEGEVYCIRDGIGYRYTVSAGDGSFRLSEVDEPETLEEDQFGYRLRVTRWDSRELCYGIVTADGTEVVAPVYERVTIPFPDRFLLYEGGASQGPVMGRCRLTDETGSTLCARFHWIDYSVFDDGYIGIAVCFGERAAYPCYDEDGQPMPEGYWLVDRDGNLLSERFEKLSFGDGDETHTASKDDVLRALREDGTEELLTVTELLLPSAAAGA